MKKSNFKKFGSALLVGALSASIGVGCMVALGGCNGGKVSVESIASNYLVNSVSSGTVHYVAPNVALGDGDGTEANPYNIGALLESEDLLQPGDTVLVKPGVYNLTSRIRIENVSGEYNKYITIKNASQTEEAVLDFSAQRFDGNNRGVQIDGDYFYWYGVDIRGAGDNGMYIGGSYNVIENSKFYNNRDTGLQLGRSYGDYNQIKDWPSYNLIKNCTSFNNYDNETYGENADGFAAKLTVGYGNIFDGCIAYRNSDDGWDLYAKTDSGNIGAVIIYNCVAFENGYLAETQAEFNAKFPRYNHIFDEDNTNSYLTRDGDGNGFKLGGSVMEGDVYLYNCQSFHNRMHGVTDNSNPGTLSVKNVTSYNNSIGIDDNPSSATFGEIIFDGVTGLSNSDGCANINMARQVYSYNIFSGIVSVNYNNKAKYQSDEYRGSAEYSIFDEKGPKAYKFDSAVDASNYSKDTYYGQKGEQVNALQPTLFKKIPFVQTEQGYTYEISGKFHENSATGKVDLTTIHEDYRNADGSVNMGEILAIQNYSALFGDKNKTGAQLNLGSWDAYTHYNYFNASNASSKEDAAVKNCVASLDLNTSIHAVFQDFDLVIGMEGTAITWESSDENILKIDTDTAISASGTRDARAIVYRGKDDAYVTLTATVRSLDRSVSMTKKFNIRIMADVPTIGEAVFEGVEDGVYIINKYDESSEPALTVQNASDYNGKLLDPSQYTVGTRIMYAEDKTKTPIEVHHFTPTVGGVYTIYKDITLGNQKKTYSYDIYVASATANVGFDGAPSIKVNRDGYSISGPVTNATGVLYAYSSKTEVADITPEKVKQLGKGYDFKADKINFQFDNDNSGNYFIYYALFNMHGDPTQQYYQEAKGVTAANFNSKTYYLDANGIEVANTFKEGTKYYEKVSVGRIPVTTVNVGDANDLEDALKTNDSSTIYLLTADIDLSAKTAWKPASFFGLLNGLGHTIKNFKISGTSDMNASLISKLEGGTVENVKFENIDITNTKNKVGIIATTYGGFLHNIAMKDVHVKGAVRVGALVGQAMTGDLYVDQISLINTPDADKYYIKQAADAVTEANFRLDTYYAKVGDEFVKQEEFVDGTEYYIRRIDIEGERSSGVIGFIQASQAVESTKTYIDNVYVDAVIGGATNKYVGGVVGSADDQNAKDVLEIDHVFSKVTIYSNTYAGGVLGSHNKGVGRIKILHCIFTGTLYYGQSKSEPITSSLKNCSGIVGRYQANAIAEVRGCYAFFEDNNTSFDVDGSILVFGGITLKSLYLDRLGFSEANWELKVNPENDDRVVEPYAVLKFLGKWD